MRSRHSWRHRWGLSLAPVLGPTLVRVLGATQKWEAEGLEALEAARRAGRSVILAFWHEGILLATYRFRGQNIAVMTSRNYDGEIIARIIAPLGYHPVRGSSSAGAARATRQILERLGAGQDVGFAIDGPRGPRRQVKGGAVFAAQRSGAPLFPFTVAVRHRRRLRSWDQFQIPRPFSTVRVLMAPPIWVGLGGDTERARGCRELQEALDRLEQKAEAWRLAGL